jgi:thiol-disulfide isomerase/thioredoxin
MISPWFARLSMRGRLGAGVVTLGLLLSLGACQQGSPDAETSSAGTQGGEDDLYPPAPDFELAGLDGKIVRLSDFEGKVVLVDFWATWCGPCRMEVPHLKELYSRYSGKGLELVGISLDTAGPGVVRPFVEKNDIPYTIVMGDQATANLYGGVTAIPTAFLIDRKGRVIKKYVGYRPLETFVADIEPLM